MTTADYPFYLLAKRKNTPTVSSGCLIIPLVSKYSDHCTVFFVFDYYFNLRGMANPIKPTTTNTKALPATSKKANNATTKLSKLKFLKTCAKVSHGYFIQIPTKTTVAATSTKNETILRKIPIFFLLYFSTYYNKRKGI